ncbi:MAG: hypothetical protein M9890_07340 [Thermomicrobiales bacterium]|nr:hypothetical protein [Thermomicrobiales bacterium]
MTNEARTPTISDRMTGALLGMAIGDALGLVGESPLVKRPITGYEPVRDASGATIVEDGPVQRTHGVRALPGQALSAAAGLSTR